MVATAKRTREPRCLICQKRLPAGHEAAECAGCRQALEALHGAHRGECRTEHPLKEERLLEFERRHALGLPLFGDLSKRRAA